MNVITYPHYKLSIGLAYLRQETRSMNTMD